MVLVTLKIVFRKSANTDLRGEERENFHKSKRHDRVAFQMEVFILSGKIMPHTNKKKKKNKGKFIKTLG